MASADLLGVRVARVLREPLLDRAPVERLVAVEVVLRGGDHRHDPEHAGLHDRHRAVERRERVVPVRVILGQRQPPPEWLADDDVPARPRCGLERVERPRETAPDEARAEAQRDVVGPGGKFLLRGVTQPEGHALAEPRRFCALDRHRVELGRDLDALDRASELLGEEHRRAAPPGRDVEHARARAEPETLPEKPQLVLGNRVLELVIALRDDEVARDHGPIVTRADTLSRQVAAREPIEGSWGIDPVPERLRVLGTFDTGLLWGNLGVSLLVIVAGAALVPALSLPDALLAILLGCVIGNAMLGVAGAIGTDARVPGMVLMRAPLGRRGSYLPTTVNVLQGLGWSIFELLIIATAAAALSDELFGFRAQWLWTLGFGVATFALALLGPIGFVRRFVRRIAVFVVPVAVGYLTWWALDGADLGAIWEAPGEGGLSVWQGADVVVAITVSWIPFAADYTRFSTNRRAGGLGTGLGYLVPDAWLLALGVVLVLSRDLSDPAALPAAVVAGGAAAILALFALLATETDEAFANTYSAAVSLQNLVPRAPQPLLIALVTAAAVAGALVVDLVSYQSFLLLLGSVFVPLFAVLLADWLATGARYTPDDVFGAPAWRPGLIAAWIAGFALYQWLYPTGPSWWTDAVGRLDPPEWEIGATVPSFLVSFLLAGAVAVLSRRFTQGAATA